eukprot:gene2733-3928_t
MRQKLEKRKKEAPGIIKTTLSNLKSTKSEKEMLHHLEVLNDYNMYFSKEATEEYINHFRYLFYSENMTIVRESLKVFGNSCTYDSMETLIDLFLERESFILKNLIFTELILQIIRQISYPKLVRKMLPFFSKISTFTKNMKTELIHIFEQYLYFYDEIEHFLNSDCFDFFFNEPRLSSSLKIVESLVIGNEKTRCIINKNKKQSYKYKKSTERQRLAQILSDFKFQDKHNFLHLKNIIKFPNDEHSLNGDISEKCGKIYHGNGSFILVYSEFEDEPIASFSNSTNFKIADDFIAIRDDTMYIHIYKLEDEMINTLHGFPPCSYYSFFKIKSESQYCYVECSNTLKFTYFDENCEKILKTHTISEIKQSNQIEGVPSFDGNQMFYINGNEILEFLFDEKQFKLFKTYDLGIRKWKVSSISLNFNCSLLAVSEVDSITILDVNQEFNVIFHEKLYNENKIPLTFMKNDPNKLVCSDDYFVKVFEISKNKKSLNDCLIQVIPLSVHMESSRSICYSQDGKNIIVGTSDGIFILSSQNFLEIKKLINETKLIDVTFSFN